MTPNLDTRPRRVWLRRKVPGKLMMGVLKFHDGALQRRKLSRIYGDEAYIGLLSAALALHLMPRHSATHGLPYGGVLADVRDFVRFRFRIERTPRLDETFAEGEETIEPAADAGDAAIVSYVVTRLGALSRQTTRFESTRLMELLSSIRALRDLLRHVAGRLHHGDEQQFVEIDALFTGPDDP
jgi:hypothetical protein